MIYNINTKERECKLLSIKVNEIELIVNNQILMTNKKNNKYVLKQNILNSLLRKLNDVISSWNGINISRSKKSSFGGFGEYFLRSKGWFDQKKRKYIGSTFWLNIFNDIKNVKIFILIQYISSFLFI